MKSKFVIYVVLKFKDNKKGLSMLQKKSPKAKAMGL